MENMDSKVDLRIKRTHKFLINSLISLLEKKSLEKISVKSICENAMVHRTTFYKHFDDKYQLLEFGIKQFQKKFDEISFDNTKYSTPKEYYMNILKNVLEYISKNKKLYTLVLTKYGSDSVSSMFYKVVVEDMISKFKGNEKKGIKYKIPIPVVANFYSGAIISLTNWWIENNMPIDVNLLVDYVNKMINKEDLVSNV